MMTDLELMPVYDKLTEIIQVTNNMDPVSFGSLYCMLAEEWCRCHGEDVIWFMDQINSMVKIINEEEGRY